MGCSDLMKLAFFTVVAVAAAAQNKNTCAEGDNVCLAGGNKVVTPSVWHRLAGKTGICTLDLGGSCTDTPAIFRPFWPISMAKLPNIAMVVIAVWVSLFLAMRQKKTDQDLQFEQRRARAVLDGVAQVCHEHEGNEKKRLKYEEREAKLREIAQVGRCAYAHARVVVVLVAWAAPSI